MHVNTVNAVLKKPRVPFPDFVTIFGNRQAASAPHAKILRGGRERMLNEEDRPEKKTYEKPTVTELTREQAKLKLMGHAMMGNENAKELLDILFEREQQQSPRQPYEKPTATELTREQARLRLMGHAMMGSTEAKELLDMLFERKQNKNETEQKKSA